MPWFEAARHETTAKNGMSTKTLERTTVGVRYRAAWTMLQRSRAAMVGSERTCPTGVAAADNSLLGGLERGGKDGRGTV